MSSTVEYISGLQLVEPTSNSIPQHGQMFSRILLNGPIDVLCYIFFLSLFLSAQFQCYFLCSLFPIVIFKELLQKVVRANECGLVRQISLFYGAVQYISHLHSTEPASYFYHIISTCVIYTTLFCWEILSKIFVREKKERKRILN